MKKKPSKEEIAKAMKFLEDNPILMIVGAIACIELLSRVGMRPAWLKDCAPVNSRLAGPWRGKGSFGKNFGPNKVRHK